MPADAPPLIAAHRLLGDGRSTALVRDDAVLDWWCARRPDSLPVVWALLDPRAGAFGFENVRACPASVAPPAGAVVDTVLETAQGRIQVRDSLLSTEGGAALVRLVRGIDADLDVVHRLTVTPPHLSAAWTVDAATPPATALTVAVAGGPPHPVNGDRRDRLRSRRGNWTALVLAVGDVAASHPEDLSARVDRLLADQDAMLERAWLPRSLRRRARDALVVLRACTHLPTGAVIAAPTTSLPEVPGGERNYDYRYTWLRDAGLGVSVAALLGHADLGEDYLRFVSGGLADDAGDLSCPVSDVTGRRVPPARELPLVAGWAGSRPVRIGNDAGGQRQFDALGFFVEAVSVHLQCGGRLEDDVWRIVVAVADSCAEAADDEPTNGIWELPRPRRIVDADIGRWLALDRAVWIARLWRPLHRRTAWKVARDAARRRVLGALRSDGTLRHSYDDDGGAAAGAVDAAALMAVLFGLLSRDDPRAARLVAGTVAALCEGPHLRRYTGDVDDGHAGREGAFVPVSWWAVSCEAILGSLDSARSHARALDAALPALLAEEVDAASGALLGNAPLLWSHAEAARAAYLLDVADIQARWGLFVLFLWRLRRYAAFRFAHVRRSHRGDSMSVFTPTGRRSSPAAEALSATLRKGSGDDLRRRRRVIALGLTASAAMGAVTLFQTGILRHLPEPPLPGLDSDAVDSSGEAYRAGHVPDAAPALVSYAITVALAAAGGSDRARRTPWIPLVLALKVSADVIGTGYLTVEQVARHRKLCSYCLTAAAASVAMLPQVFPEARAAWRSLRGTA